MQKILGFGLVMIIAGAAVTPAALAQGAKGAAKPAAKAPAPKKAPPPKGAKGAAGADADPTDPKNLARSRYDKGRAAEQADDLQTAYEEYRAAYAFVPEWRTELAWARVSLKLGKEREAAEMFQHVSRSPEASKGLDAAGAAELQKGLAEARSKVGALQIDAPAGAEIWVGGAQVGVAPLKDDVFVEAGEHDVGARKDGALLATAHVKVDAGGSAPVKLIEGAPAAPTASAAPSVTAAPAPTETSAPTATAAVTSAPVPSGGPVAPPSGPRWPIVIALGGAAIAGAAVGAGLWVAADGKGTEAANTLASSGIKTHADCKGFGKGDTCAQIDSLLRSQDSLQTGAAVGWIVGGAAAFGAVATWAITRRAPPQAGVHVSPAVAPGHAGLVIRGSW